MFSVMKANRYADAGDPNRLRRNCVKPALACKNFARAGSSVKATILQIFRAFRVFRGQKI